MIRQGIYILFLAILTSASATAAPESVSGREFQAYQALTQTKLDAAQASVGKDQQILQTRLDSQDKRLNDLQSRISDIGLYLTLFGILIALIAATLGLIGYFSVRARASEEARKEAQRWFDEKAQSLTQKISDFEQQLASQKEKLDQQADQHSASMQATAAEVTTLAEMQKQILQDQMSRSSAEPRPTDITTTPAAIALDQVANQLRGKAESEYSIGDWNNRAFAAIQTNQLEEAIYFWQRATEMTNAEPSDIARALYNKGVALGQLGRREDEIVVYDDLLSRFGEATELPLREQVAKTLLNKGVALGRLGRSEDEIVVYDDLLVRFGEATELPLREQVAKALLNKGVALGQLGRSEDEIALYDDLLVRFGDATELPLHELVAKVLLNKGVALGQLGRREDEIVVYDDLLSRFGEATELPLREQVAKTLLNKGVALGQLGRSEDEIALYDDLLVRFGDATELPLHDQVAKALLNKGVALGQLGRREDEIVVYDDLLSRFGEATELPLREHVAKALLHKGVILGQLGRSGDEIAVYDDLLSRFGEATELPLREIMAIANNGKGFALLCRAKAQWHDTSARTAYLSSAANHFVAALEKTVTPDQRGVILGNQAYTAALSGEPEKQIHNLLQQALMLGCESLYQSTLKDLEISPVTEDAKFRLLLDAVWNEVKPHCEVHEKA